jgi:hypothetical protein
MGVILGLIESPLQLNNFINYLAENEVKHATVIIRLNGSNVNDSLIKERLIETSKSTQLNLNTRIYKVTPGSKKVIFLLIFSIFHYLTNRPDVVVIGDYRSFWNKYMFSFFYGRSKFVFVDDGLATLSIYEQIKDLVITRMNIVFYTKFSLQSTENIKIIKPSDGFIKLLLKVNIDKGLMIGSPLIEKGIVTKCDYIKLLNKIIEENECEITYCYHRAENLLSETELKNIGFSDAVRFSHCIEDAFKNGEINYGNLFGFYSTVLANSALCFDGINLTSYYIPESLLLRNVEQIKKVYDYFMSTCKI